MAVEVVKVQLLLRQVLLEDLAVVEAELQILAALVEMELLGKETLGEMERLTILAMQEEAVVEQVKLG